MDPDQIEEHARKKTKRANEKLAELATELKALEAMRATVDSEIEEIEQEKAAWRQHIVDAEAMLVEAQDLRSRQLAIFG